MIRLRKCAWCGSTDVAASRPRGLLERLMALVGGFYRCRQCYERSYWRGIGRWTGQGERI